MFLVLKSSSETLQAEEKRRWPTFSTLDVWLHEVGGAASAGWFIGGIIAKGAQTVHFQVNRLVALILNANVLQGENNTHQAVLMNPLRSV